MTFCAITRGPFLQTDSFRWSRSEGSFAQVSNVAKAKGKRPIPVAEVMVPQTHPLGYDRTLTGQARFWRAAMP